LNNEMPWEQVAEENLDKILSWAVRKPGTAPPEKTMHSRCLCNSARLKKPAPSESL
jgi:hypothetical protein